MDKESNVPRWIRAGTAQIKSAPPIVWPLLAAILIVVSLITKTEYLSVWVFGPAIVLVAVGGALHFGVTVIEVALEWWRRPNRTLRIWHGATVLIVGGALVYAEGRIFRGIFSGPSALRYLIGPFYIALQFIVGMSGLYWTLWVLARLEAGLKSQDIQMADNDFRCGTPFIQSGGKFVPVDLSSNEKD